MEQLFGYILLFIIAIIVHECGHFLAFLAFGIKPNIKIRWYSIEVSHPLSWNLKAREFIFILLAGVLAGYPFVQHNQTMLLFYVILSSADLINIYQLMSHWRSNKSILQINKDSLEKAEEEIKNYEYNTNKK